MPIKKLYVFFLFVFFLSTSAAQAARQEQLLLVIPEISGQAPSSGFFSVIHSAVSFLAQAGSPYKINIISKEQLASDYAKIVLSSYGLGNAQVQILQNIDALRSDDIEELEVFGDIPLTDQAILSQHEIECHNRRLFKDPPQYLDTNSTSDGTGLAIIALGTGPLDETTPSLDMVKRVEKTVMLLEENPQSICIFSGGRTAGNISEARMMALIANSRGVPPQKILLEEASRTTIENARLTALLVQNLPIKKFILVTRPTHMERAISDFRSHPEFEQIQPAPTDITQEEIARDLKDYLDFRPSDRVRFILKKIMREYHGN